MSDSQMEAATNRAVELGWTRDDADDAALVLMRAGREPDEAADLLRWVAICFPGPGRWHDSVRAYAEKHQRMLCRLRAALGGDERTLRAIVDLCQRRLGITLFDGIEKLTPLGDLVVVLDLPDETLRLISPLSVSGQTKSPGWFVGQVLALPHEMDGLRVGDRVLVEDRCSPDGAGFIPSEEMGLAPGGRVIFVPCRRLPTAPRSEEVVERMRDVQAIKAKYPVDKFPTKHKFWRTPDGEAVLAQLGSHSFHMRSIMAQRKGCARNRLVKAGKEDTTLPDGIIAVVETEVA